MNQSIQFTNPVFMIRLQIRSHTDFFYSMEVSNFYLSLLDRFEMSGFPHTSNWTRVSLWAKTAVRIMGPLPLTHILYRTGCWATLVPHQLISLRLYQFLTARSGVPVHRPQYPVQRDYYCVSEWLSVAHYSWAKNGWLCLTPLLVFTWTIIWRMFLNECKYSYCGTFHSICAMNIWKARTWSKWEWYLSR